MAYQLETLATRSRTFRVIKPSATLEGELLRIYTPILTRWRTTASTMVALYAAGGDPVTEADNSDKEIAIFLALMALRFTDLFGRVETWHRAKWIANVKAATGVDATWMTAAPSGVARGARTAVAPVSGGLVAGAREAAAVSQGFARVFAEPASGTVSLAGRNTVTNAVSDAITSALAQARSLSDEARNRIINAVVAGQRAGASAEDVARNINKGLALGRKRAGRIAENELDNAVKALTDARMAEAGLTIAEWEHNTRPLWRARPEHYARDKKRYAVNDPIWNSQYEPFCRCQKRPVLSNTV